MESHSKNSAATVSLAGIRAACDIVYQTMQPSLLTEYPLLNDALGARAMVKHENHLPTGAFKIRGGLNFMHHFVAEATHHGVIGATRGNHGQSIALAAQRYGIPATIVVPHGNNPEKNAAMRAYGARLVEHGEDFAAACGEADRLAAAENLRFIHSANEPHLINGVGTYALEIIETAQARGETIDAVFVPIGMGSGLCGVITAFRDLSPTTKIYGVQATGAPSVYLSWQAGHIVTTETANTFADGMATRLPAEMTFDIIKRGVDEIILVSDDEIAEAIRLLWRTTHNLVEGAGAAATAAAWQLRDRLRGQNVVHVFSGANLDSETLGKLLPRKIMLTFDDILAAQERLRGVAHRTPVLTSKQFNAHAGCEVFFKAENLQRAGAFKFRGAYNCIAAMDAAERERGILAFSSGNHAQAVALAAQIFGVPAAIVMPHDAPAIKVAGTRGYGAEVIFYDRYQVNREELGQQVRAEKGYTLVPPFDDYRVMAGQGTAALELLEDVPDLDYLLVCVSGGGLIAGCATAAKHLRPEIRVFGVEPETGNDTLLSLQKGERVDIGVPKTIADGLQVNAPGKLTFPIVQRLVENILLVSDDEMISTLTFMLERMKVLVEPSGAVGAAAVWHRKHDFTGKRVGVIISGGNVDLSVLGQWLQR